MTTDTSRLAAIRARLLERVTQLRAYSSEEATKDLEWILAEAAQELGFGHAMLYLVKDGTPEGNLADPDRYEATAKTEACVATFGYDEVTRSYYRPDVQIPLERTGGVVGYVVDNWEPIELFTDAELFAKVRRREGKFRRFRAVPKSWELAELRQRRLEVPVTTSREDWERHIDACIASVGITPPGAADDYTDEDWLSQRDRFWETASPMIPHRGHYGHKGEFLRQSGIPLLRTIRGQRQLWGLVYLQTPRGIPVDRPTPPDIFQSVVDLVNDAIRIPVTVSAFSAQLIRTERALAAANLRTRVKEIQAEQTEVLAGQMAHEVRGEVSPLLMALDSVRSQLPSDAAFQAGERALVSLFASAEPMDGAAIREAAEFLKAFAPGGEVASRLATLRDGVTRIERTVEGVMDYARLGKELAEEGGPVDLAALVNQVADEFPEGRVIVQASSIVSTVRGHGDRLHQALRNLVRNAVEAVDEAAQHGRPLAPMEVSLGEQDGKVAISIRDHGVGITPEQQAKLFTPMFTTKPTSGHGLGLATAQRIVEAHGGEIRVETMAGKGSTFTVVLPTTSPANGSTR